MSLTNIGKQPAGEVVDTFYVPVDDVMSDEPATYLREYNAPIYDGISKGRFQEIHVLRDTYVGKWVYNLGPSRLFTALEFQVIGGSFRDHHQDIETVESIRDYADWLRDMGGLRKTVDPNLLTVTQENLMIALDNSNKSRKRESVFGRHARIQR